MESVTIGTDRVGRAVVRFGRSELAEEIFQDVQDGIRSLVSVGYMINEMEADEKNQETGEVTTRKLSFADFQSEMRSLHGDDCFERATKAMDAEPVFRVTGWTPFEISVVSIPADPTVGIGRSVSDGVTNTATALNQPAAEEPAAPTQETKQMDKPIEVIDHAAEEKARVVAIRATAESYAQYGAKDMALEFIAEGKSLNDFNNAVMEKMKTAHTKTDGANVLGLSTKENKTILS